MQFRNLFRALLALVPFALAESAIAADSSAKSAIERGRYIVSISGCNDCHTPGFMLSGSKTPQSDWLTGSALGWRGSWGTTYPANLRLFFQALTEEQWVLMAKEMRRRPPMPYYSLNAMSEADVRAIYQYIRSLGPAGKPAPPFVAADKVPPQPYVQFPD